MSSSRHSPAPTPAASAAPKAVVSTFAGRETGNPNASAWICMSSPLALAPPSTRRRRIGRGLSPAARAASSASARIASKTSTVWKLTASSRARHTCADVECCVSPTMTPRASARHLGANRPENAGTNTTLPASGTERALASISDAALMIPMLSRSHCTPAPATATEPSSAYAGRAPAPRRQHTVDRSPRFEGTGLPGPVLSSAKHPVPYVFLASPGAHRWPSVAACWSPTAAARATPASAPSAIFPNASGSAQETISGRTSSGTPSFKLASASHASVRRFMSIVRLALVQSVTKRAPFVKRHTSQVSTVPIRKDPVRAAAFAAAQCSSSQRILVPAKYVLMGRPQVFRSASLPPRSRSRSEQICAVRVSSHTMALWSGFPDSASHATTVSR
mmetsp:Transcript_11761/g.50391  ORF Transcript_11761/g.50391 Transcript_11761/m.50391 type:complete len:391 (-) Transcript_11761:347-1519(-)